MSVTSSVFSFSFLQATNKVAIDKANAIFETMYKKEQVEELLQKQRELCAEQIYTNSEDWIKNRIAIHEAKLKLE